MIACLVFLLGGLLLVLASSLLAWSLWRGERP